MAGPDQLPELLGQADAVVCCAMLHDGNAARGRGGAPVILDVLPRLLETFRTRQLKPVTLRAALS